MSRTLEQLREHIDAELTRRRQEALHRRVQDLIDELQGSEEKELAELAAAADQPNQIDSIIRVAHARKLSSLRQIGGKK
jgi:hypothetical protein